MRFHSAVLCAVALLVSAPLLAATKYKVVDVKDGGRITGRVAFDGTPPKLVDKLVKDGEACHAAEKPERPSPRLTVGPERGVKNAVVFLTKISKGKGFPSTAVLLDQKQCSFEPHVVVVPRRAALKIRNSDPVLHNVHGFLGRSDAFNLAMPNKGQVIEKKMRRKGVISLKCDAGHSWMSGYVFVVEHPYYAVTDAKGNFKLDNVPAGQYELRVWHEGWTKTKGKFKEITIDVPVAVEAGADARLEFHLSAAGALKKKSS